MGLFTPAAYPSVLGGARPERVAGAPATAVGGRWHSKYRALGGGARDDNGRNTRFSNRYWLEPGSRNFYTGFRWVGE